MRYEHRRAGAVDTRFTASRPLIKLSFQSCGGLKGEDPTLKST